MTPPSGYTARRGATSIHETTESPVASFGPRCDRRGNRRPGEADGRRREGCFVHIRGTTTHRLNSPRAPRNSRSASRLTALLAAVALLAVTTPALPADSAGTFGDVSAGDVHAPGIAAVAAAGLTTGYADGTFRPGQDVTRGQMATFLFRGLDLTDPGGTSFPDVAADNVHAPGIRAVAAAGIAGGFGDGTYRAELPVTRAQMATFLVRALEPARCLRPPEFSDVTIDSVHAETIATLARTGITTGFADGTFRPDHPVTRGQMATFLTRSFLERVDPPPHLGEPTPDPEPSPDPQPQPDPELTPDPPPDPDPTPDPEPMPDPVPTPGPGPAASPRVRPATLAAGYDHACAIGAGGILSCWGRNQAAQDGGQLGDGTTTNRPEPAPVIDLPPVVEVSAGHFHTCALTADGRVACWGRNYDGQLGDGTRETRLRPVWVVGLSDAVNLDTGGTHTCAVRASGAVSCWGSNRSGQLGTSEVGDSPVPVDVTLLSDAVQVALGNEHSCVRHADNTASCWGSNHSGQLGVSAALERRARPVPLLGLDNVAEVAAGDNYACAVQTDGHVACWGWGRHPNGLLQEGCQPDFAGPQRVAGIDGVTSLAVGARDHACARRGDGRVSCWGMNQVGQLGLGLADPTGSAPLPPAPVVELDGVVEVTAGYRFTCARRSGDELDVRCWGRAQDGQLGTGAVNEYEPAPTRLLWP